MPDGEKILLARRSPFNLILVSEDARGLRTLRFGHEGVRQSVVKLGDPDFLDLEYAHTLPLCLGFVADLRRILIVGLGGGTLPSWFHHQLPDVFIDVVEIDADVLEIAKTFCGFEENARLRVSIEDGRDFIERTTARYDLIVLDGFNADAIPPHLSTLEFLTAVRRALTPEGIVAANIWGRHSSPSYDDALLTYREAFADLYILDVRGPGSKVFIGLPAKRTMTRDCLLLQLHNLTLKYTRLQDRSAALFGFRHSDHELPRGGRILRD